MARRRTAPEETPQPGISERIPGFTMLERIGSGGFSVVYRAHQERLDRPVAVKVLAVEFIDASVRRRFLREVKAAGRLTEHAHVVTVLETGMTASGRPFIAMDLYSRGSLAERLAAEGPLPAADVIDVGVKIGGALAAAHALGVVHLDVKPQNILVSRYGQPALADFGTARLTAGLEATARTGMFTPYHAAPEVLRGEQGGPLSDVYSLASTLYQLLAGRPPYPDLGDGVAGMLLRAVSEPPPPVLRSGAEDVLAVVLRGMAKDPAERFVGAAEFATALAESGAGSAAGVRSSAVVSAAVPVVSDPEPDAAIPLNAPLVARSFDLDDTQTRDSAGAAPGPDAVVAVVPSGMSEPPPPARSASAAGLGRRWGLTAVGVVVAAVVAPVAFVLADHGRKTSVPQTAPPSQGPATSGTAGTAASADAAAVRPIDVVAEDQGTSVFLHWQLPGPLQYVEVVEEVPAGGRGTFLTPLSAGTTSTRVTGLDPSRGYCFLVASLMGTGGTTEAVYSQPTPQGCVRGAIPSAG